MGVKSYLRERPKLSKGITLSLAIVTLGTYIGGELYFGRQKFARLTKKLQVYADSDNNGKLDDYELGAVCEKMGYKVENCNPTVDELAKAVEFYEKRSFF